MQNNVKATLLVIALLVVGAFLGAVGQGALTRRRADEMNRMRNPGGFVEHMRDVIRPRDDAQWEKLRPYLEITDARNRAAVDAARDGQRVAMDSLRNSIDSLLDGEQRQRLEEFARRPPPDAGGRRGGPPQDGLGPPPGRGGPPPRP